MKSRKEEIKEWITILEERRNGIDKINGAYAVVRNLRIRRHKAIADIILNFHMDGKSERYNDCEYPLEKFEEYKERVRK